MHADMIKLELKRRGSSLAQIARELGLAYSTVYTVANGARSRRVEVRIAQVLGMAVEDVFPDRYPLGRAQ